MSDVFIMCPRSGNYCTHTGCNVNWRLCDEQRSLASDRTETDLPEEKNDLYEACKNECLRLQQMIIKLQDREEILKGAYENALNRIEELKHKDEKMNEEKKQAIRPEELRLNNLVAIDNPTHWPDLKGKPMSVTCIELVSERDFPDSSASIGLIGENRKTYSQFNEFIKPIELSPEWLERLGFDKVPLSDEVGHYFETQLPNGGYLIEGDRGGVCSCFVDGHTEWRVYTVHGLQNLYFALCGQELKLQGVC